jgi:PAP2 superfamily
MRARQLFFGLLLLASPYRASAQTPPNSVIHWAGVVQQSIHNAAAPRSAGSSEVLHTMVHLAVYDAVVAIEGESQPFAMNVPRTPGADVNAAVAAAAYATARPRVAASQRAYLDQEYESYLAQIPASWAKAEGVRIGWQSATTMLKLRANDRFNTVVTYQCSPLPLPIGEFEPDGGCPSPQNTAQPVDVKLGQIKPYVLPQPELFRPDAPLALSSLEYATDFAEVHDFGRDTSAVRTAEQTDVAFFWAENPYVHWNRNLTRLATSHNLSVSETARLFAMAHTAVSDAIIVGFGAKYYYKFWRPRTAIPLADYDENTLTVGNSSWKPLLLVNHPEYPSGHGFWSGALLYAVESFFQTPDVTWTIATSKAAVPRVEKTERTYTNLQTLETEIGNARVWGGLHFRNSINVGGEIGDGVALAVLANHFRRIP